MNGNRATTATTGTFAPDKAGAVLLTEPQYDEQTGECVFALQVHFPNGKHWERRMTPNGQQTIHRCLWERPTDALKDWEGTSIVLPHASGEVVLKLSAHWREAKEADMTKKQLQEENANLRDDVATLKQQVAALLAAQSASTPPAPVAPSTPSVPVAPTAKGGNGKPTAPVKAPVPTAPNLNRLAGASA